MNPIQNDYHYYCDEKFAFSNAFYNSHVFSEWNKLLLHTFNSAAINCVYSVCIFLSTEIQR